MTDFLEKQVDLIRDVLEFNKRATILKISPSKEEIEDIRNKCANIKVFNFKLDVSDIELIEQISEFADTYK